MYGSVRETRTSKKNIFFLKKQELRPKLRKNFLTVLTTDEIAINSSGEICKYNIWGGCKNVASG